MFTGQKFSPRFVPLDWLKRRIWKMLKTMNGVKMMVKLIVSHLLQKQLSLFRPVIMLCRYKVFKDAKTA
jgi:orotidine-5'-phosphate decarboxylase